MARRAIKAKKNNKARPQKNKRPVRNKKKYTNIKTREKYLKRGKIARSFKTANKKPAKFKNTKQKIKLKIHGKKPKRLAHRKPVHRKHPIQKKKREFFQTKINGLDSLFEKGIPTGSAVLVAGGAGSGKTIMCLQILKNIVKDGKKCLFMSFEESEKRIIEHMEDFGWKPEEALKSGHLKIQRFSIFDISRSLDALMAKAEGELLIDVKPVIIPKNFIPDMIVVDSLTAIASAFTGKETYRSYIEQLFRYFESLNVTSFLITETAQVPTIYSPSGVEEFLADGVIVLYNIRKGDIRESAIEILKMRGTKHTKKIVAMQITGSGVEIYPDQEVFSGIK